VLTLALMARFASQGKDDYAGKLLAMMRKGFGGHAVHTSPALSGTLSPQVGRGRGEGRRAKGHE